MALLRRTRFEYRSVDPPLRRATPAARWQPRLERLEDRLLLTPYTVTNINDSGPGSLRQGLQGRFTPIDFSIGGGVQIIRPLSPLPTIIIPTLIDGTTQPGYAGTPLIVLDGTLAGTSASANGLTISGGGSTVDGLVIGNFHNAGIFLETGGNNLVTGNYIGTDVTGTEAQRNSYGVFIDFGDAGNVISGNLLSGNGVALGMRGQHTRVVGNLIGTNAAGRQALGNGVGVDFLSNVVGNDTIGGTAPGDRNIISGNSRGVEFGGFADEVLGNYIGTDISGTAAIGNGDGIYATTGGGDVGGTAPGAGNVISGNGDGLFLYGAVGAVEGNLIGLNAAGTAAVGNYNGLEILSQYSVGGTAPGAGNVISGNLNDGILVDPGGAVRLVQGNFIGTNAAGTAAVPNGRHGLELNGGLATVGGTAPAAGNLIAGNALDGLSLTGDHYLVQGNTIGTNAARTAALPNRYGISVNGSNSTIGGTSAAARNLIAGNRSDGVVISAGSIADLLQGNVIAANSGNGVTIAAGAIDTLVLGNAIGTTPGGGLAYGNGGAGISIAGSSTTIGGTSAGAGNLISGNTLDGLVLAGNFNQVLGNTIGSNAAHSAALPNRAGISITGTNNTIGGTGAAATNIIGGNRSDGVMLSPGANANVLQGNVIARNRGNGVNIAAGASNNVLLGNAIGTTPSGSQAYPNGLNGVMIAGANNTVGGTAAGAGNTIAFNGNDGVLVDTGTGNAIQENAIFESGNLGIELANGGNNNQPFPVLTSVRSDGSSTTIEGTLTSTPDTTFTVEFYANDVCNPSGYGEGQTFLGSALVTTDPSGAATFTVTLSVAVDTGQFVASTATDPDGDTSGFSACLQIASPAFPGSTSPRLAGATAPRSADSPATPLQAAERRADLLFRSLDLCRRRPVAGLVGGSAGLPARGAPGAQADALADAALVLLGTSSAAPVG
jgi:hypothetical protein